MSRPSRYRRPESFATVTLAQFAREIDRTPKETARLIKHAVHLGLLRPRIRKKGAEHRYDAAAIEVIKAMLGVPNRLPPDTEDWLTDYLKGDPDVP